LRPIEAVEQRLTGGKKKEQQAEATNDSQAQ
jgi:hypothetical protein